VAYARLLNRWNRADEAKKFILDAVGMFRGMGMTHDMAEAEREASSLA
jgi:hypothetical protein